MKYKVSEVSKLDDVQVLGKTCEVTENIFNDLLIYKITQITSKEPHRFDEVKEKVEYALGKGNVTIKNISFSRK